MAKGHGRLWRVVEGGGPRGGEHTLEVTVATRVIACARDDAASASSSLVWARAAAFTASSAAAVAAVAACCTLAVDAADSCSALRTMSTWVWVRARAQG